jgi:fucose permease
MEFIQEAIASRNIVVWAILLVLLIVLIKVLKSASKGLIVILLVIGFGFLASRMFPDLFAPAIDFVRGGWLGDNR